MALDIAPFREKIEAAVAAGVPSVAVALAVDGEVVWEEGFGLADRAASRRADADTPYSLASITKPMTATALMRLVESGRVDLDRPIDDYLGEARITARLGRAEDATVARVLDHTAGLPMHYQFFYADEPFQPPPFEETARRYAYTASAPGEIFEYSNLGYGLLDHAISTVGGGPYADFVRAEVFEPLGMTRSGIGPIEGCAVRYLPSGDPLPSYVVDHPGASMAYASASDLVRFGLLHLGLRRDTKVLRPETLRRMQRGEARRGAGFYGLGWQIAEEPSLLSHGGAMPGVTTSLLLIPERDAVIALLANATPAGATAALGGLGREIVGALLGRTPPEPPPNPLLAEGPPLCVGPERAGVWRGAVHTFDGVHGVALRIDRDGSLHLDLDSAEELEPFRAVDHEGTLYTLFPGAKVETPDTTRAEDHFLSLALRLRGNRLTGQAIVGEALRGERMRFALSHWIELSRV